MGTSKCQINLRNRKAFVVQRAKGGVSVNRFWKGRVLRAAVNTKRGGYRYVCLHDATGQTMRRVCVLVAAAFLGLRPDGLETCHKNGLPADDSLANLRYGTHKSNCADRVTHGTHRRGEDVPTAKLTEANVREILASRQSHEAMAVKFGVHPGHIYNIRHGLRWAHV